MYTLRSLRYRIPIADPTKYIEVIPFNELKPITMSELKEANINIDLAHQATLGANIDAQWMIWKPPSRQLFHSHHFHTEDEVYQYCVENQWYFPGHFIGEFVVFEILPLKDSKMVD